MGDRRDVPLPKKTFDMHIILVRPQHPGNLGAVCRAMLNFGFTNLVLIDPRCSPDDEEARNRAKHAGSILDSCQIFPDWETAVNNMSLVVGTSGKREGGGKTLFRHFLLPWDFAEKLESTSSKVALVFGEEGTGLSTEELQMCDFLVTLPTWEGYPICNLSHAVALMLYEINRAGFAENKSSSQVTENIQTSRDLSPELRKLLRKSIDELANSLEGDEDRKRMVADNLRRTILRGMPIDNEAQRLIGSFVEATTALQKVSGDEDWMSKRRRRLEN